MNTFQEQSRFTASEVCVFFVHGYLSSPHFFEKIINLLPANIDYLNILLPGHGGDIERFSRSGMAEWEDYVAMKLEALRGRYRKIIVVGHSLGTLLLIGEVMRNPAAICGSVYLDVPLIGKITVAGIEVMLKSGLNLSGADNNEALKAANYAKSVEITSVRDLPLIIPSLISLLLKMRETRNNFAAYPLESIIFQSKEDELVSSISNNYIKKNLAAKLHIMSDSGHFAFSDSENTAICEAIMSFVNKSTGVVQ